MYWCQYLSCSDNGANKIFDSLARGKYGWNHSLGTCVLLEVSSIQSLVQYFQAKRSLGDETQRNADYQT